MTVGCLLGCMTVRWGHGCMTVNLCSQQRVGVHDGEVGSMLMKWDG